MIKFSSCISQNFNSFIPHGKFKAQKSIAPVGVFFLIKNSEEVSINLGRYNQSAYKAALNTDSAFYLRNQRNTDILPVQRVLHFQAHQIQD
jgi:hypothetical protein